MQWLPTPESLGSIIWWKEPEPFVRRHRKRMIYGQVQFKIMVGIIAAMLIIGALAQLKPKEGTPKFTSDLWAAFILGPLIAYGVPLFDYFVGPTVVRLYANCIVVSRIWRIRYFRFDQISGYEFEPNADGWILNLRDLEQKNELISIPGDELKTKVETAFLNAEVPQNGLSHEAIAQRHKMAEEIRLKALAYRMAMKRSSLKTIGIGWAFIFLSSAPLFFAWRFIDHHPSIFIVWFPLFFAGLIGTGLIEGRGEKCLIRDLGLNCANCTKVPKRIEMNTIFASHMCPCCKGLFFRTV